VLGEPLPVRRRSATSITESTIGTIIAAVAVFDTHMLTSAVAAIVPATIALGRVPTMRSVARRCAGPVPSAGLRAPARTRRGTGR